MHKSNIWESPENNHQEVKINEQSSTITDRNYVSHGILRTSKSLVGKKKYKFLQSTQCFFFLFQNQMLYLNTIMMMMMIKLTWKTSKCLVLLNLSSLEIWTKTVATKPTYIIFVSTTWWWWCFQFNTLI